jgi:hypothetical protein
VDSTPSALGLTERIKRGLIEQFMDYAHWALRLLSASVLIGCGGIRPALTPQGLHHDAYGYDVVYRDVKTQTFLGEHWRLDNFFKAGWGSNLTLKSSGPYQTTLLFDTDDDGTFESSEVAPTYDLRFEHRITAGVIWLKGVPLSQFDGAKDLRVMMHDWITDLNGTRLDFLRFDDKFLCGEAKS